MDATVARITPLPTQPRIIGERPLKITARDVNIYYGDKHAIKNLSIDIPDRAVPRWSRRQLLDIGAGIARRPKRKACDYIGEQCCAQRALRQLRRPRCGCRRIATGPALRDARE